MAAKNRKIGIVVLISVATMSGLAIAAAYEKYAVRHLGAHSWSTYCRVTGR